MENLEIWTEQFLELFGSDPRIRAAIVFVVFLVAAKAVDFVISKGIAIWTRRTKTDLDDRIIAALHRPVIVTVVLIGAWLALRQLEVSPGGMLLMVRLIKTLVILVWTSFLLKASSIVWNALMEMEDNLEFIEPRTVVLLDNVSRLLLVGGAIYALFLSWGIDVGGLLVGAGVMGIALGLAAKDTLANLFSGIFILADAPYQVGDFVVLESGERGQVSQVGLRSTRLLTRDDIEVTVPNAVIANAKIINESGGRWEKERVRVKVGVAYGSDLDHVTEVLLGVAQANEHILDDPSPRVRFRNFGDSSLDLELLGWIAEPILRGRVLHALNLAVYKRFDEEGIEIPYAKLDVNLNQVSAAEASD